MKAENFYTRVQQALLGEPGKRHLNFSTLHAETLVEYTGAVKAIDAAKAAQPSSDGRSLHQVVGHIMEWDRYMIQAIGEMLSGIPEPQMWSLKGFHLVDNSTLDFKSIDDFNAYHAGQQSSLSWEILQSQALDCARVLYTLFTTPGLMDTARLDATGPSTFSLPGGIQIQSTLGWQLWMVVIEHEGVEHAVDLFN